MDRIKNLQKPDFVEKKNIEIDKIRNTIFGKLSYSGLSTSQKEGRKYFRIVHLPAKMVRTGDE